MTHESDDIEKRIDVAIEETCKTLELRKWTPPPQMHAQFFASATLPPNLLNWTLNLLESQLKSHYENAPDFGGWNPIEKQQDLLDPTGRFIFLFPIHQETPIGVLYFQFVKEETLTSHQDPSGHCAALYVLELLVDPQYHGQNIGHWFMELAMDLGKGYGMEKVMLTCFKSNARALRFYEKMGYELDDISPDLEDTDSSYVILSKDCK